MELLLWAERRKLRRSKILWIAGFATVMVALIVFAQGQFTFYESRYIDGAGWFMTAAQSLATFYVLPAVIALLGSYMICREEQEDTLKSLRLIPVDEVKLTLSKMVLALVFSVVRFCGFRGLFYAVFKSFDNLGKGCDFINGHRVESVRNKAEKVVVGNTIFKRV